MSRFELSNSAAEDLESIDAYTTERFGLMQAVQTRLAFTETLRLLSENPKIGGLRDDLSPPSRPFRFMTVLKRFVVVYEPSADGIRVARVLDGSRDLPVVLSVDPGD